MTNVVCVMYRRPANLTLPFNMTFQKTSGAFLVDWDFAHDPIMMPLSRIADIANSCTVGRIRGIVEAKTELPDGTVNLTVRCSDLGSDQAESELNTWL